MHGAGATAATRAGNNQEATRRVLIYASREESAAVLDQLRAAGCEIAVGSRAWQTPAGADEDAFFEAARDIDVLMGTSIRSTPITRRIIEASPRLRIIAKYTVGVDDVDIDAATEHGILVCHAPTEANCFSVAETTMAMMLAILKRVRERDAAVREGGWRRPEHGAVYLGRRLSDGHEGITVGIVGLGRIGTRFADLLAPWRVRIIAYDPYAEPSRFLLAGVERVDLDTLLRQSDVVSMHCVLTRETRYMISTPQLALMKPDAILLNSARGKIVDEKALAEALAAGRIRAAALDALEVEPLPSDSPLLAVGDKVLLSPHAAAFSGDGQLRPGIEWAARSVLSALMGEVPDNVYNKAVIPRWTERFAPAGRNDRPAADGVR